MSQPEYVTAKKAREMLGVSTWKMAQLLSDGTLKWRADPFNKRRKLILKTDVEELQTQRLNVIDEEEEKDEDGAALAIAS